MLVVQECNKYQDRISRGVLVSVRCFYFPRTKPRATRGLVSFLYDSLPLSMSCSFHHSVYHPTVVSFHSCEIPPPTAKQRSRRKGRERKGHTEAGQEIKRVPGIHPEHLHPIKPDRVMPHLEPQRRNLTILHDVTHIHG